MRRFQSAPLTNRAAVRTLLGEYSQGDSNAFPQGPQYNEDVIFDPTKGREGFNVVGGPVNPNGVKCTLYPLQIADVSQLILGAQNTRGLLILQNLSAASNMFVNFGQAAVVDGSLRFGPGEGVLFDFSVPTDQVFVVFNNAVAQPGIVISGIKGQ